MIQTHTVGFCGPFRSRSVTLLLDPTTLGKPDFRSRTLVRRRTHSDLDYLLKYTQRYTVVYLGPIRSLLDPFQVSHTIIETPDSLGLTRTHSDSLGITRTWVISLISDRMAGWPPHRVSDQPTDPRRLYISQQKYILNLVTIHTLIPYHELSHTIIPVACMNIGLFFTSNHVHSISHHINSRISLLLIR